MDAFPTPFVLMAGDLAGALAGFVLFAGFLVFPGWAVGLAGDVLGFRTARFGRRLVLALGLSVCVSPILAYLLARTGSMVAAEAGFLLLSLAGLVLLVRDLRMVGRPSFRAVAVLVLWIAAAAAQTIDWVQPDGMASPILIADYLKHVAVTDAVARTGLPPVNPAFFPGQPVPLFYYYLWFVGCALVDLAGGGLVEARQAVYAGTLWMGPLAAALVALWAERLSFRPAPAVALALMLATGLDLIPNLVLGIAYSHGIGPGIAPDLEWWNDQVSSWLFAWLWVPHHMAGFVAAMTGFLLLLDAGTQTGVRRRWTVAVAGCGFASLAGLSVWVAVTAVAVFAAWCALEMLRKGWRALLPWAVAGVLSLVLALPFLLDLAAAKQVSGAALRLAVREFWPATRAWEWFGADLDCGAACRLALLPLNYGLELGFFLFAAPFFWLWRRKGEPLREEERFLLVAAAAGLLVATFVRADLHNNDLGWRAFLFVQFPLLLWSVPVARALFAPDGPRLGRPASLFLVGTLFLGLLVNLANVLHQRVQPNSPTRLEQRQVFHWIATHLPRDAVVQYNPDLEIADVAPMHLERQTAASDLHFGWLYGIRRTLFHNSLDPLARLFEKRLPPEETACLLNRFGIDVLIAADRDLIWQDRQSWVWTAPLLLETAHMRVVRAPR